MTSKHVRCAIYTRKSSEEGLEQSFNSLEAQREACQAFILSQKHEGWTALNNQYDDGGFSGGTMERPALKQLLDDILAGKVDTVVVYKVDRLTRALNDFSKIIEVFDSHSVSFVSVTQAFNTTTSMGRLTLNVLLSFAQFEREVTGERIRDKVAASKKKGMWMGGVVSLGYDCVDHQLIVNQAQVNTVREIFRQYLRLGCVRKLKNYLEREGIRSKVRTSKTGHTSGGTAHSRGALYHLLNNRIYIGEIVHRGQSYPGQHEAIVSRGLWDQVAATLKANTQSHRSRKTQSTPSLLSGIVYDTKGVRFTPTHAVKNGKRYRYYTSQAAIQHQGDGPQITRYPAGELENLTTTEIHRLLGSLDKYLTEVEAIPETELLVERARNLASQWSKIEVSKQHALIRGVVKTVTVGHNNLWIEVDKIKLITSLLGQSTTGFTTTDEQKSGTIKLTANFHAIRKGAGLRIDAPDNGSTTGSPVPSLVKAIARARGWYELLISGELSTVKEIAQKTMLTSTYVKRILQCAMLSPRVTEAILSGNHPHHITLEKLLEKLPMDWQQQARVFLSAP